MLCLSSVTKLVRLLNARLPFGDRLPSHVARPIPATGAKRHNMSDHVARAKAPRLAARRTRVLLREQRALFRIGRASGYRRYRHQREKDEWKDECARRHAFFIRLSASSFGALSYASRCVRQRTDGQYSLRESRASPGRRQFGCERFAVGTRGARRRYRAGEQPAQRWSAAGANKMQALRPFARRGDLPHLQRAHSPGSAYMIVQLRRPVSISSSLG